MALRLSTGALGLSVITGDLLIDKGSLSVIAGDLSVGAESLSVVALGLSTVARSLPTVAEVYGSRKRPSSFERLTVRKSRSSFDGTAGK
ncbi:hypothetical protein OYT88_17105 [Sporolactobacillus sp. CQH2019]|uniref:hypothetical protein n=1 Tax=Sporolactobacillus sp. CQH2019 TaxID=3023512 RepID=UPI002368D1D1|nr:hypothetical protein [Sporolactobacillus sp. CQH2019]MDD9150258.1 hypothetical protein [Sporolactobacillus sp. CQH2019]